MSLSLDPFKILPFQHKSGCTTSSLDIRPSFIQLQPFDDDFDDEQHTNSQANLEDSSSCFQPTAKDTKYSTSIFIAGDDTNQAEHQGITYDNILLDLGDTIESVGNVIELADRLREVAILKDQQKDIGMNDEIDVDQSSITITEPTEPFVMKEDSGSTTA